jgi:hypothetical protein
MFQLSKKPEQENEPRTQILYGTHSPFFVDLQRFDQIKLARKIPVDGTTTLQTKITSYTKEEASKRLAEISQKNPEDFTEVSFVAHASPVMTTIVNEGFFSDLVVIVEGISEVGAIWELQKIKLKNWDALGISVIPAGCKNNIDRPVVVFRGLDIPTYFIFDGDSSKTGKNRDSAISTNHLLLRLAGSSPIDFPPSGVYETWAVFNDRIEKELESATSKEIFDTIRSEVADILGYNGSSDVLKNSDGAALFVKRVYDGGGKIPILEEIVEKVTNMRNKDIAQAANAVQS